MRRISEWRQEDIMFEVLALIGIGLAVYALFNISRQIAGVGQLLETQNDFLKQIDQAVNRAGR